METRHKILLLDDDPDLLAMYREILGQLPSRPEIHTATSGARAMAMLEADPFRLLICDLKMPKMDGLQVLSIVRRKYPELRTVVLTSVADEQFRSRVYALGVDLFWQKPAAEDEIRMFVECLESLLGRESEGGFRGVQSKSLVDIIQLECISQSSSVLRITNGELTGKIWINEGELIDAETEGLRAEEAFKRILSWKAGNFETFAAEPGRPRTIFSSYNALLLETAQAIDEARSGGISGPAAAGEATRAQASPLAALAQVDGVEFVLAVKSGEKSHFESRGLENPERLANWSRQSLERFRALGDHLQAGPLEQVEGLGPQRHVGLALRGDTQLCVGWQNLLSQEEIRDRMKKLLALWIS
jgi:CheY-like chemotaxis protein